MRIGGTEQVIKNLIEGSDKNLFDMSIYCLEQPIGPFGQMLINDGVSVTGIQRKDGFDFNIIRQLRKHIKKNNIDILHCHQYTPWVYGTLAAIGTATKIIFTEHGRFYPDQSSWKRRFVNPVLTRFTDHITAISKATKQALIDYEFIPEHKIKVIYNGIIPLKSEPEKVQLLKQDLGISETTTVLGTIARLDPIKNHKMMLNAFRAVVDEYPDTVLLMVGDGEERQNMETQIRELNLNSHVILTGYIDQPKDYLDCMDIFLLSSLSEGTSMTLLEAMSLAKPCVVTDAGGNSEIITDQLNGLVTKNNNTEMFSEAIINLISDPIILYKMKQKAKAKFEQLYSAANMYQNYIDIYL